MRANGTCRWDLSIHECRDRQYFEIVQKVSMSLFALLLVLSLSLLLWRLLQRKSNIWIGRTFAPLDGFLFLASLWCAFRITGSVLKLYDLIPETYVRNCIHEAGWALATISVSTYAAGLFYAIPRMQFHQRTGAQRESCLPLCLPKASAVPYFYWTFVLLNVLVFQALVVLATRCGQVGRDDLYTLLWRVHWIGYAVTHLLLAIVLVYYGQMLVNLAQESVSLAASDDEKEQYQNFANKMRLTNIGLTIAFVWYIVALSILGIAPDLLYSSMTLNKVNAAVSETWSSLLGLVVVCSLIYNERSGPRNLSFDDLTSVWRSRNQTEERV